MQLATLRLSFLPALGLVLAACASDAPPSGACGDGQEAHLGEERHCVFEGALIVEGFLCPADMPNQYAYDDYIVCSAEDALSPESLAAAIAEATAPDPSLDPDELPEGLTEEGEEGEEGERPEDPPAEGEPLEDDPCDALSCEPGTCVIGAEGPTCECPEGFAFDGYACAPFATPCAGVDCGGVGECVAEGSVATCDCDAGYVAAGATCIEEGLCPEDPVAESCPAACTGGCDDGVCVIDCGVSADCRAADIVCPDGIACRVECSGPLTCFAASVTCPSDASCDVQCSNELACSDLALSCGSGACGASCSGADSGAVAMDCGDACSCETTCGE